LEEIHGREIPLLFKIVYQENSFSWILSNFLVTKLALKFLPHNNGGGRWERREDEEAPSDDGGEGWRDFLWHDSGEKNRLR
jgi:hypothetical protein